jgi:antitoxin HigA-1
MKSSKEIKAADIWNEDKQKGLKDFILSHSKKQSPERKLRNELLAIQYRLEDYIENNKIDQKLRVLDFVKMYLKVLGISQKSLARFFEMQESNLHKYLAGQRKLNTDIAFKLSAFSHTEPETWLRIEIKNELLEVEQEKKKVKEYEKYDYRNLLVADGD